MSTVLRQTDGMKYSISRNDFEPLSYYLANMIGRNFMKDGLNTVSVITQTKL